MRSKTTVCFSAVITLLILLAGCHRQSNSTAISDESKSDVATDGSSEPNGNRDGAESRTAPGGGESSKSEPVQQPGMRHGPGMGRGMGMGRGVGRGRGARGGMRGDMTTIHAMFAASDKINRTVKNLANGAEATTESDDEEIASLIQQHVPSMETRVLDNQPLPPMTFHPIFVELIRNADHYRLDYEDTDKGVTVTYAADDPYTVMLVQEHAKLVSRFLQNGMAEIHKPYKLPVLPAATGKSNSHLQAGPKTTTEKGAPSQTPSGQPTETTQAVPLNETTRRNGEDNE